jgi:hypothetical protein
MRRGRDYYYYVSAVVWSRASQPPTPGGRAARTLKLADGLCQRVDGLDVEVVCAHRQRQGA